MTDFADTVAQNSQDLPEEDQKKIGKAQSGAMDGKHKDFLKIILDLLDSGSLNVADPLTFLNTEIYEKIDEQWKDKTDLALMNIVDQVRLIEEFYRSTETPDESPQLESMIDHLWQMKQQIEEHHDVFKF